MIEVYAFGNGWRWRMLCAQGRTLVYDFETFACNIACFAAAKAYRTAFWAIASQVDHRMGSCI